MQREQCALSDLLKGFEKYPQALVNVRFQAGADPLQDEAVKAAVQDVEQRLGDQGRVLLRKSGTEPLIRVMVEGRDPQSVKTLAQQIAGEVEAAAN
jgi:phosphoglucosamine mutase